MECQPRGSAATAQKDRGISAVDFPRKPRAPEEARLVKLSQRGDHAAFTQLVEPHMRKMYYVALRITGNREDAEDAAQQTLLNAYLHIDQFRCQSAFSTWLTHIAMNEALGKMRKRRTEETHVRYDTGDSEETSLVEGIRASDASHPESLFSESARHRVLNEAIGTLRSSSRAIVWLLGIQERPAKEAAKMLKLSESAVKARFWRARNQLRACLADRI
ncbi:MAG: sigma-70 family RNA polymerase sigma factor [Candidatus Acidiferrales bacterium]